MVQRLLDLLFRRLIQTGTLTITWPDGSQSRYGTGATPSAGVRITDSATLRRLLRYPQLAFGEAYMDGALTPTEGGIHDVLEVITANLAAGPPPAALRLRGSLRRAAKRLRRNDSAASRRNVAHHYDLNEQLYATFLDADRQYSCAYFPTGSETLDQAQQAKLRHIAAKLKLDRPGARVLDIGCGWGGLALHLAREHGAEVTGITLSEEQLAVARRRADAAGLAGRVQFELRDYRAEPGVYDRIVSVGMFEHVGVAHYAEYFATIRRALAPDGVALVHSIGNSFTPSVTNPWLEKYIFPGGYSPSLSEVIPSIERQGLIATDIEILRLHYARTLALWRQRFTARRAEIAALYDERFCRMFEFYLSGCEMAFRAGGEMVFQVQLARSLSTLPITRDYMLAA
jgi:cyclopropane-fatty-acyl-phospholipid synthase